MVQTKSGAGVDAGVDTGLSSQISELTTLVSGLRTDFHGFTQQFSTLSSTVQNLDKRIEEVNLGIKEQIQTLERNIATDIKTLRDENQRTNESLENYKEKNDATIKDLRSKLDLKSDFIDQQTKRIVSLEKSCHQGLQHNRAWNLEIDGIPENIGDDPDQLEDAVLQIFNAINVDVTEGDIDTIHRLNSKRKPKPTNIRFISRKTVRDIHANKSKLRNLENLGLQIPGLTDGSQVFIRASQCPYFSNLAYNCRLLKRNNFIKTVFIDKEGRIQIKLVTDEKVKITHEVDLLERFPTFKFEFNYDNIGSE